MRNSLPYDDQARVLLGQNTIMCVHVNSDHLPVTVLCTFKAFAI